jgi:beta-lactamase regulating signal transducer with metallopeptidase domain
MIDLLLAASLKGTALIVLVIVIQWMGRERIPAGWRYAMWLLVLLRLLMPVAPASPVSLFNLAASEGAAFEIGTAERTPPRTLLPTPPTEPVSGSNILTIVLLTIWAAGFAGIAGRAIVATVRLHRQVRRGERVHCPDAPLPLVETDAVSSPALHGILRPKLLVPPGLLEQFDADERRYIFLHEVAHLRRGDVIVNCIAALVEAVHWFNPLVWLALARMREERELACDRAALSRLSEDERSRYGRTILKLLDCFRTPASAPALVGMASRHDEMKRRIHMIAAFRKSPRVTLAFSALIVALGFASLTDAQTPEIEFVLDKHSPAMAAVVEKLHQPITLEMKEAGAIDVAQAIANSAGVTLSLSPDATAEIAAAPKISIKATAIPAHLALVETLHNARLGMKFTDTGVEVSRQGSMRRFHIMHPGEGGEAEHGTFIHKLDDEDSVAEAGEKRVFVKKIRTATGEEFGIEEEDIIKLIPEGSAEGPTDGKQRVFVRHLGKTEGQLEIEVHK